MDFNQIIQDMIRYFWELSRSLVNILTNHIKVFRKPAGAH